ncbi:hypothetical protein JCM3765_000483 [Sporobolomyces pararoseus]
MLTTTLQLSRHSSRLLFTQQFNLRATPTASSSCTLRYLSTAPQHSYQPHPNDASPSSSPTSEVESTQTNWKGPSRPHEQYLLTHPVYTKKDLESIQILYLPPKNFGDKLARFLVNLSRKSFDLVTGYKHADPAEGEKKLKEQGKEGLSLEEKRKAGYVMTKEMWLQRILFLESIAGVPGFTAAIHRHLRSLRGMKRDSGYITTLLAEAENERMHLLSFMKVAKPSAFFRLMVLAAQGVFFNIFFLCYLLSPRASHRFVAYLEEEACYTYTHAIEALDRGELPEWEKGKQQVPTIAKDYWRLGDNATMRDFLLAVRADEAGHRFVNHTLANLNPDDPNPVAMKHATPIQQGRLPGLTREESLEWAKQVELEMRGQINSKVKEEEEKEK